MIQLGKRFSFEHRGSHGDRMIISFCGILFAVFFILDDRPDRGKSPERIETFFKMFWKKMKNLYQYIQLYQHHHSVTTVDIKDYEYDTDMFARPLLSHIGIILHFPLFKHWHVLQKITLEFFVFFLPCRRLHTRFIPFLSLQIIKVMHLEIFVVSKNSNSCFIMF